MSYATNFRSSAEEKFYVNVLMMHCVYLESNADDGSSYSSDSSSHISFARKDFGLSYLP